MINEAEMDLFDYVKDDIFVLFHPGCNWAYGATSEDPIRGKVCIYAFRTGTCIVLSEPSWSMLQDEALWLVKLYNYMTGETMSEDEVVDAIA